MMDEYTRFLPTDSDNCLAGASVPDLPLLDWICWRRALTTDKKGFYTVPRNGPSRDCRDLKSCEKMKRCRRDGTFITDEIELDTILAIEWTILEIQQHVMNKLCGACINEETCFDELPDRVLSARDLMLRHATKTAGYKGEDIEMALVAPEILIRTIDLGNNGIELIPFDWLHNAESGTFDALLLTRRLGDTRSLYGEFFDYAKACPGSAIDGGRVSVSVERDIADWRVRIETAIRILQPMLLLQFRFTGITLTPEEAMSERQ